MTSETVWQGPSELQSHLWEVKNLRLDPENARIHKKRDLNAIKASLEEFGQRKPIVALKDGRVIAGNGTFQAALMNGWTHLAVIPFEDEAKAKAYGIADNRTSELSSWNDEVLVDNLRALIDEGANMAAVGFTDKELEELLGAPDPEVEPSDISEPEVEESSVKTVQIMLDEDTHAEFIDRMKYLSECYGTDNITDTLLTATATEMKRLSST